MKNPCLTAQEWRWAAGWSIIILLLSCLPYLIAIIAAPEGWQFAGILANPYDGHSYLAKIRQGMEGNWLFHLTYTPEPHQGVFIFTFYLLLGHLAALLRLSPIMIYHLARLITGLCLLLAAFRFIAWVTPQFQERRLAFILLLSASGLGWLGVIFGAFPIDLWVPEAFVHYSLYTNPHFPLAMTLMLIIFQQIIQPSEPTKSPKGQFFFTALAALALAIISPFALLVVGVTLTIFLGWLYAIYHRLPWRQIWLTLNVGLFSAPIIGYQYWVSATHPVMIGWSAQNITAAPPVLDLLLGYGPMGLLAIVGGWLIITRKQNHPGLEAGKWLIFWWAVSALILLYLPFALQRRFITGLHIPLCILAAIGLQRWLAQSRLKLSQRRQITAIVITLGVLGTLFVWSLPLLAIGQAPDTSETTALLFIRQEEVLALAWLRENITMGDVVLASPRMGMFIPGQTGARVYYGHPFETIEAKQKKAMVEAFYRGQIEEITPAVDFIIYGPGEKALGRPHNLTKWPAVFSTQNLVIYETKNGGE